MIFGYSLAQIRKAAVAAVFVAAPLLTSDLRDGSLSPVELGGLLTAVLSAGYTVFKVPNAPRDPDTPAPPSSASSSTTPGPAGLY